MTLCGKAWKSTQKCLFARLSWVHIRQGWFLSSHTHWIHYAMPLEGVHIAILRLLPPWQLDYNSMFHTHFVREKLYTNEVKTSICCPFVYRSRTPVFDKKTMSLKRVALEILNFLEQKSSKPHKKVPFESIFRKQNKISFAVRRLYEVGEFLSKNCEFCAAAEDTTHNTKWL